MDVRDATALAVALGCYLASLAFSTRLPAGHRHRPVAAFGPVLVALGPSGYALAPLGLLLIPAVAGEILLDSVQRRRPSVLQPAVHGAAICACAAAFALLQSVELLAGRRVAPLLVRVTVAAALVPMVQAGTRAVVRARRLRASIAPIVVEEVCGTFFLDLVCLSIAGLSVLAYGELGPFGVVFLLAPLAAAHTGFTRYVGAQGTYYETVRALGRLTERGGYAPPGHHERVAALAAALARAIGLWGDRVRKLELVALVHEVGSVSLPDPEDVSDVRRADVLRAGARVLEETGYLAGQAGFLAPDAEYPGGAMQLEARIIRLACAFDRLPTDIDRVGRLTSQGHPDDGPLIGALRTVLDSPLGERFARPDFSLTQPLDPRDLAIQIRSGSRRWGSRRGRRARR